MQYHKGDIAKALPLLGFHVENTGGGCSLMAKTWPRGTYVWVSSEDGCDPPSNDDWLACVYPVDGEPGQELFRAASADAFHPEIAKETWQSAMMAVIAFADNWDATK